MYQTLFTSPINYMRCLPSSIFIFIFLQQANLIGPPLKKLKKPMEAPRHRRFYFEVYGGHTLWPSYIGEKGGHQLPKHRG